MLEKTARGNGIKKDDLKIYLKGNIDDKIYNEMCDRIDNNENLLKIRAWLKKELQKVNKKYVPVSVLVNVAKANEQKQLKANIEEYKEQKKINNDNKEQEQKEKLNNSKQN